MLVKCEICDETIASARRHRLRLPLDSTMFEAIGPEYPDPWFYAVTWEHMRCPICGNRPFVMTESEIQASLEGASRGPTEVLTTLGRFDITTKRGSWEVPERVREVYKNSELRREWNKRMAERQAAANVVTRAPRFLPKSREGEAADARTGS